MKLCWSEIAWKDYLYWQENDKKTLKKINKLIENYVPRENARMLHFPLIFSLENVTLKKAT